MRLSEQLVRVARARLSDDALRSEANLRRATSDLYHAICEAVVEPLPLDTESHAFRNVYRVVYRLPSHGQVESKCRSAAQGDFHQHLRDFAKHFISMKSKREAADYDQLSQVVVSVVRNDCAVTESRLAGYWSVPAEERSAFACYVGLRVPKRATSA